MLLQSLLLLSAYATRAVAYCDGANDTLVKTSLFTVQGVIGDTPNVRVFRGIPYAEPPVGPAGSGPHSFEEARSKCDQRNLLRGLMHST